MLVKYQLAPRRAICCSLPIDNASTVLYTIGMNGDRKEYIYGLFDPETGAIRYIGRSWNVDNRYKSHCFTRDRSPKAQWVKSLAAQGQRPDVAVLQECADANEAKTAEYDWIMKVIDAGGDLLNARYVGCENPYKGRSYRVFPYGRNRQ